MIVLAVAAALLAFAGFALSSDAPYHAVTGRRPTAPVKRRWRGAAWVALTLSAASAIAARGWVFGPVWWAGTVMLAAGIVFLALNLALPALKRAPGAAAAGGPRRG